MNYCYIPFLLLLFACDNGQPASEKTIAANTDTIRPAVTIKQKTSTALFNGSNKIATGLTTRQELLSFANTLIGIPYLYASVDPVYGFDCSGFITYVFNHFDIAVPRSSVDFTGIETEVPLSEASPGDLILFTGTDSLIRIVGHMGIVASLDNNQVSFIHSTSGKANGVTITPLNDYYKGRFIKVIRIFP